MGQASKRFKICQLPSAKPDFWQTNSRIIAWVMLLVGTIVCNWETELQLIDTTTNTQLAAW